MKTLKELNCTDTAEFEIIDEWTHREIETLPRDETLAKYGNCKVYGTYTCGSIAYKGFKTAVWLWIPGMHIGYGNGNGLTIPCDGDEVTFTGKKSGQLITVTQYGPDDYSAWWRDPEQADDETAGCSVRGTGYQIYQEIKEEV